MSKNYDNWERLLTVVLRREWDKYLALCSSSDDHDPTNSSDGCSSSRPSFSCYDYPGSFGARAKNNGVDMDAFSEKSDEERIIGVTVENLSDIYDTTMNISERRTVNVDPTTDGYESNVRSNFSLTSQDKKRAVEANDIIQGKPETAQGFVHGFNNLEYTGEQDRAELLNKMDELRDQLSRPGNSIDKGKAKASENHVHGYADPWGSNYMHSGDPYNISTYSEKLSNASNDRAAFPFHDYPHGASSEVSGFARPPPRARHLASSGGKHWRPIGGGAPILSCFNCFEVLLLPQKVLASNNRSRKKMRCGVCSTIITFSVSNNHLIFEPVFGAARSMSWHNS